MSLRLKPSIPHRDFNWRHDLGLRMLVLYVAFVLPVIGMALYFERVAAQRLRADVENADLSLARAIAEETNLSLGSFLGAAQALGEEPAILHADMKRMQALFSVLAHSRPEVNLVYRLNSQGMMLYHYSPTPIKHSTIGVNFSFRDYFKRAKTTRLPFFSHGRISPTTGQPVVTAVMPLWNANGEFIGILGINIRLEALSLALQRIAQSHRPDEHFLIFVTDDVGKVIATSETSSAANSPPPDLLTAVGDLSPDLGRVLYSGTGHTVLTSLHGQAMLFTVASLPSVHWHVLVGRSASSAFTTAENFRRAIHLALLVVVGTGVLFWLALMWQILRPLEEMAAYSRSIGEEGPHPGEKRLAIQRLGYRPDQVGHLARTLLRMEADIAARMQELHTLLETSTAVASTLDSATVLRRILEQVERLLGTHKCAIIAWDEERQAFVVRASLGLSEQYAQRLVIARDEFNSLTLRAIRTGQPLQISDTESDPTATAIRPRARAEGYRAVLAVPLPTQHTPPAALVVYYPEPHTFTRREIDLLTSFANHAAMAIENAALFARSDARLQEQTRRLEALIQSMGDALLLEDHQGRVLYANRRMAALADLNADEMTGVEVGRILRRILAHAPDPTAAQAAVSRAIEEGMAEITLQQHGRLASWLMHVFSVTDAQGIPIGRGQIWKDITESREVDRMKASLISIVSHELRTPLAAIKGYASTLLADDVEWDPESQREFLQTISDETDRLSALVSDLLDLSRIEGGSLKVEREPIDLAEIIAEAAQNAHPSPGKYLEVHLPNDLPTVYADGRQIGVVIRNLIENAVKYGGEGSPVRVSVAVESDAVVVRVEDEGPGIPAEHVPYIFESFYRVESGLTQQASGAGLGLAICRGFVEAHGGKIWVEPRAKGACLAFSLPLLRPSNEESSP